MKLVLGNGLSQIFMPPCFICYQCCLLTLEKNPTYAYAILHFQFCFLNDAYCCRCFLWTRGLHSVRFTTQIAPETGALTWRGWQNSWQHSALRWENIHPSDTERELYIYSFLQIFNLLTILNWISSSFDESSQCSLVRWCRPLETLWLHIGSWKERWSS